MGGLSVNAERSSILEPLYSYHRTAFVLAGVVYKPYTSLEKLALPFSDNVWYAIAALLTVATAIIGVLKVLPQYWRHFIQGPRNNMPFFNMVAAFLGLGVTQPARRNFARFLLAVWTLASIVVRNSYQGTQFNNLRSNTMRPPPSTINQLIAEKYTIHVHPIFLTNSKTINQKYMNVLELSLES